MRSFFSILIVIVSLFLFLHSKASAVYASATIEFSPTSGSYNVDDTFTVDIIVNTDGQDTTSTDAKFTFDNTLISVENVSYGSFYPTVTHSKENNSLLIMGLVDNPGDTVNGSGTLATVTFKALAEGSAVLEFVCVDGSTDDSNIFNSSDIIDCSSLQTAQFTIGNSASTIGPATATPIPADTTPSPTSIPQTGGITDFQNIAPMLFLGLVLITVGIIPLVL